MTRKSPLLFDGFIQMLSTGWNIGRGLYCNLETELMASTLAQEVAGERNLRCLSLNIKVGWYFATRHYYQRCSDEVFSLSSPDHLHGQREDDC